MKEKAQKSKRGELRRSLEASIKAWNEAGIRIPETIEDFARDDWTFDAGGETVSADYKTSEGPVDFYKAVGDFEIHMHIPFKSVRIYGKPVIDWVCLLNKDGTTVASVRFDNERTARIHVRANQQLFEPPKKQDKVREQ